MLLRNVYTSRGPSKLKQKNNADAIKKASNEAVATCPRLNSYNEQRRRVHGRALAATDELRRSRRTSRINRVGG